MFHLSDLPRPFRILFVLALVMSALPALAQENTDCLDCHEDEDLTKNRDGRVVSLFIDIDKFDAAIHGLEGIGCVDCHMDLDGVELLEGVPESGKLAIQIELEFGEPPKKGAFQSGLCGSRALTRKSNATPRRISPISITATGR